MKTFFMRNNFYFLNLSSVLICLILVFASLSYAQDFTATSIGDYGNVTVMEASGNYDARNSDGSWNDLPRQVIAKEFFRTHKDEYDFLVIFSNFDFQMPESEAKAFYLGIKNDTQGIGNALFDNSSLYGSNGKLQGTIDMGNLSKLITDSLDPDFEDTLNSLGHEFMHRWGAYVRFKDSSGNISTATFRKGQQPLELSSQFIRLCALRQLLARQRQWHIHVNDCK